MNYTWDLIILAILALGTFFGVKRGFFKSIAGLLTTLASLVGASILSDLIAKPLTTAFLPILTEKIMSKINIGALDPSGIDLVDKAVAGIEKGTENVVEVMAGAFIESVVRAVSFLVFFIVLLIVLKALTSLLDTVLKLPVLKTANGLLGGILGFIETALFVFLAVYLAGRFGSTVFTADADNTILLNIFVNSSPFDLLRLLS